MGSIRRLDLKVTRGGRWPRLNAAGRHPSLHVFRLLAHKEPDQPAADGCRAVGELRLHQQRSAQVVAAAPIWTVPGAAVGSSRRAKGDPTGPKGGAMHRIARFVPLAIL